MGDSLTWLVHWRLGWNSGILNNKSDKPKGMHWVTFKRLQAGHDFPANAALVGMVEKLGLLGDRLERR